jgi:hypothetical protein
MSATTPPLSPPPVPPPPPSLGEKSAGLLLSMFQDFYRQEVSAEEDVHRTLPFFATALGLMIAALNYTASQLPPWTALTRACGVWAGVASLAHLVGCGWAFLLTSALLAIAACSGLVVLWRLLLATRLRAYKRVGPEANHLARVQALLAYHAALGLSGANLDQAIADDLREQLLTDYATVLPANRERTAERYHSRASAVWWLILSLSAAIFATILAVVTAKFGL